MKLPHLGFDSIAGNIDRSLYEVRTLYFDSTAKRKIKDDDNIFLQGSKKRNYFLKILDDFQPDIVGLTSKTFEFYITAEIAKIIKSFNRDIITVLGGYHATINYQDIFDSQEGFYFDFIIRGEGEQSFNKLLESIRLKQEPILVNNISYKLNSKIVNNPNGPLVDLNQIRIPDRHARINNSIFRLFGIRIDSVETSRGCVFDCSFCSITQMYGKSFRKYKIERVIEDISDAQKHGAKFLFIVDDNITIDIIRLEKLCDAIISAKLNNLLFIVQASINGLKKSPTIIPKMAKAGFKMVSLGIESPDDGELQFISKSNQFRGDDIHKVVSNLQKHKIFVEGLFIVGTPDETKKSIKLKYEYATKLGLNQIHFSILTPFPGTQIRKELIEQNLITNIDDFSKYTTWHANIRSKALSSTELFNLTREFGKKYHSETKLLFSLIKLIPGVLYRIIKIIVINNLFYKFHAKSIKRVKILYNKKV